MTVGDQPVDAASGAPQPAPPPMRRSLSQAATEWFAEEGAKGALIAAVSTVAVFGFGVWLAVSSDNWPAVQQQFFNRENFVEAWPQVLGGFWLDIRMFVIAQIAILILALVIAVLRSLRGPAFVPLRLLTIVYIDLFRGIPLILAILLFGFGIPALDIRGVPRSPLFWGVTTLVLSYSAYTAEVYRSGIDSVPESQRSSARSLGLTQWQSMRYAILPQAVRNVIPALLNGLVSLQKDVALVSVLGVREAVREAEIYTSRTFNYTSFVAATVLFLLISIPAARFADWYAARDRARRQHVAA
jgi:polar amino acid transport system permease protein